MGRNNNNLASAIFARECREQNKHPKAFEDRCLRSDHALSTLQRVSTLSGHEGCVNAISFNASGTLLVSGSDDRTVKVWDVNERQCLTTIPGHISNVFATTFVPCKGDKEIVSGGNDADIRHVDLVARACSVYRVHTRKVLRVTHNPQMPDTFLSCSADGTVRMIDLRVGYQHRRAESLEDGPPEEDEVLPQAFGGGRVSGDAEEIVSAQDTLVLRYNHRADRQMLFGVDFHPTDGRTFVVAGSDGNIRLFDLRFINDFDPASYINIFRNRALDPGRHEVTGCVFSRDGTEVVGTWLDEEIYTFDVSHNFELEGVDYGLRLRKRRRGDVSANAETAAEPTVSSSLPHWVCSTCGKQDYPGIRYKCLVCHDFEQCHRCRTEDRTAGEHRVGHGASIIAPSRSIPSDRTSTSPPPAPTTRRRGRRVNLVLDVEALMAGDLRFRAIPMGEEAINGEEQHEQESGQEQEDERDEEEDASSSQHQEGEEHEDDHSAVACSFKQSYRGHISCDTIKACNFYGPNSEYVISGSDDAMIYVWEKESGRLLRILKGHNSVVNCVVPHPSGSALLASSGIDNEIILWDSVGERPSEAACMKRTAEMQRFIERNLARRSARSAIPDGLPSCQTQ